MPTLRFRGRADLREVPRVRMARRLLAVVRLAATDDPRRCGRARQTGRTGTFRLVGDDPAGRAGHGPPEHQDAGADEYREWDMKDEDYRIASTRPPWPDSETEPPNPTDNPTEGFDYDAADEAIRDDFADDAERDVLMGWDMFADDDDLEVLDGWRRKAR